MFESIKIINECKKVLKRHNIKYCDEFRVFKKFGLIHCQIDDWRGPTEVDGFPVLTEKSATLLLIESCASTHYLEEEKNNREILLKNYPQGYGEYEHRKYWFEKILEIFKNLDTLYYEKLIHKYTKYLNMNKKTKQKWCFNKDTEKFENLPIATYSAVIINKVNSSVKIYNQDPCGGKLNDNIYNFLSETINENIYEFTFTNDGIHKFYLKVYNPIMVDSSENYIMIYKADKVEWIYVSNDLKNDVQIRTFLHDGLILKISGEINI